VPSRVLVEASDMPSGTSSRKHPKLLHARAYLELAVKKNLNLRQLQLRARKLWRAGHWCRPCRSCASPELLLAPPANPLATALLRAGLRVYDLLPAGGACSAAAASRARR